MLDYIYMRNRQVVAEIMKQNSDSIEPIDNNDLQYLKDNFIVSYDCDYNNAKNFIFKNPSGGFIIYNCSDMGDNINIYFMAYIRNPQLHCNIIFLQCNFYDKIDLKNIHATIFNKIDCRQTIFHNAVYFNYSHFLKRIEFSDCEFKSEISFDGTNLFGGISCENVKFQKAIFTNTVFGIKNESSDYENSIFYKVTFNSEADFSSFNKKYLSAVFRQCEFKAVNFKNRKFHLMTNFLKTKFDETANFMNTEFEKAVNFAKTEFKNIASFNDAIFNDYVDFSEAKFNKIANFSNAQFKKAMNFSSCSFDGGVNLINSKLDFEFEDLKNAIQNVSIDNPNGKQPITEVANNFRDSFRVFKSSLIKDNNNLDAANFHRAELYCKEIELKLKTQKTWRDVFDWWQLIFYRITSNHHTDLFRILLWTLGVMGIFGTINLYLNIFTILLIVSLFLFGLNKMISDRVDFVAFSLFSIAGIYMFLCEPNTINPVNFLNTDGESNKIAMAIRVIYTLIIGLLLFSLQKTARKNSIVPS